MPTVKTSTQEYDPISSPTSYTSATMPAQQPFMPRPATGAAGDGKREQRLIVVSNRLPVTINKDENGEYHFKVGPSFFVFRLEMVR